VSTIVSRLGGAVTLRPKLPGQRGEDGGDDMGGDGAGGVANAAFVGGGGVAEGRQEVGGRGVDHRRDRRCGSLRGGHCGWY
jgi:hypothetical protein